MDYVGTESIKQAYAQSLIDNGKHERGLEIYAKDRQEPVFEGLAFHPESEPIKELINNAFADISIDLIGLNKEILAIGNSYENMLNIANERLAAIDERISAEEDRIRDINIICGSYSQFDIIIPITPEYVNGVYFYDDNAYCGALSGNTKKLVNLTVTNVEGNGVEGNENVEDGTKLANQRKNLVDNDVLTSWEYGRFTSDKVEKNVAMPVNMDNEDARCTISFQGKSEFGAINIQTTDDIVVEEVLTSYDLGRTYTPNMAHEIHLNDKDRRYDDPEYAYSTGIIAFPSTPFIKLQVRSDGTTDEKILDKNGKVRDSISRHRIKIDNIKADGSSYSPATFSTDDLIDSPVKSIAVYANEYIPPHFAQEDYCQYTLTVNGIDYDVVPVNSNRKGIKVIRFSDYSVGDDYIVHINETIKSARLKVRIDTNGDGGTPYISNLKVCCGKVAVSE